MDKKKKQTEEANDSSAEHIARTQATHIEIWAELGLKPLKFQKV